MSVFSKWSALAKAAPFPSFNGNVDENLVKETHHLLSAHQPHALDVNQIQSDLKQLWNSLGVTISEELIKGQSQRLFKEHATKKKLRAIETSVRKTWQPHWRKMPTPVQFDQILSQAQTYNQEEGMMRMLEQYLQRWKISQNKLQHDDASLSLALSSAA